MMKYPWSKRVIYLFIFTVLTICGLPTQGIATWKSGKTNIWNSRGLTKFQFDNGKFVINGQQSPFLRVPISIDISCGDGEVTNSGVFVLGGHSIQSLQVYNGNALYQSRDFELYTGEQFSTFFNVNEPGNFQKHITINVEKSCVFPDSTTGYFQETILFPIQFRILPINFDKNDIQNALRKEVGFLHTCPDGWVIDYTARHNRTGKQYVESPQNSSKPFQCTKLQ